MWGNEKTSDREKEGRKRDGEIEAEREGGGWRFIWEKSSEAGVKGKKEGDEGWQRRGER